MTAANRIEPVPRATWTPLDLAWMVQLILRKWAVIVAGGLVGVLAMLALLMITPPRYDITAKVFVRLGREMTAPPVFGAKDGAQAMPAAKRPEDIASEVEILTSPVLIRRTVEHFGEDYFLAEAPDVTLWQKLKRIPKEIRRLSSAAIRESLILLGLRPATTPLDMVTLAMGAALSVEPVRKSDVIEVKLGYPDARGGEAFLTKFLELALESHVEAHRNTDTRQFFAGERAALATELKQAEQRILSLRVERDANWSAPEQRSLLLKAQADLQFQQAQASTEAAQASAEIAQAQASLKQLSPEIALATVQSRNRMTDELAARMQQLTLDRAALQARYSDNSPEVRDVQLRIEHLRAAMAAETPYRTDGVTTGPNQQYEAVRRDLIAKEGQLEGQRARAAELARQLDQLRDQIRSAQATEIEISQAERDVARLRRGLDLYDKGLEDARIADAMDAAQISNLKIIAPPLAGILPAAPSVSRYLIIGLVGGLVLAAGFVMLRDIFGRWKASKASFFDRSFSDPVS